MKFNLFMYCTVGRRVDSIATMDDMLGGRFGGGLVRGYQARWFDNLRIRRDLNAVGPRNRDTPVDQHNREYFTPQGIHDRDRIPGSLELFAEKVIRTSPAGRRSSRPAPAGAPAGASNRPGRRAPRYLTGNHTEG